MEKYDALQDFKKKKLTHPYPSKAIKCHGAENYFWKIIRFGVLLNSWKVDEKLIHLTKQNYHRWFIDSSYWNKQSVSNEEKKNYEVFVDNMFNQEICFNHTVKQYSRMLKLFDDLNANSILCKKINNDQEFRHYFVENLRSLPTINKHDIIQLFAKQK